MRKHTIEPWSLEDSPVPMRILGKFGTITCAPFGADLDTHQANGRRVVACVNACANMSDEELEGHGVGGIKQWMDDADETLKAVCDALEDVDYSGRCEQGIYVLKQQRDELLAALVSAVETIEWIHGCHAPSEDEVMRSIYEGSKIIAKARGKQ